MSVRQDEGVDSERVSLRAEVDALTVELLDRYEEVTLLYDLARDMGVVLDVEEAASTALARIFQVIPASLGMVLFGTDPARLKTAATYGNAGEGGARSLFAYEAARIALQSGRQMMVHAGGSIRQGDTPVREPVLVTPLLTGEDAEAGAHLVGVVVFVGHDRADRFSAGEAQLGALVARQLAQGVENAHLIKELREKERLESQLELAAQIQHSLLPVRAPYIAQASLAAVCQPADQVGGDYYDFVPGDDETVDLVVADVTGHGMGPGLIMAMTRSVLRAQLRGPESLPDALCATNSMMWEDLVSTEAFITVFAARYSAITRVVSYVNGGHHAALLRRRDGLVEELTSEGMPFGLVPSATYEQGSSLLAPGDAVLIFSDGLVEACDPTGAAFGSRRLRELMREAKGASAEELVATVLEDLRRFLGSGPREDDVTVVALCVDGDAPAAARQEL